MKLSILALIIAFSFPLSSAEESPFIESAVDQVFECNSEEGVLQAFDFRIRENLVRIKGSMIMNQYTIPQVISPAIFFALFEDDTSENFAYWLGLFPDPDDSESINAAIQFYYRGSYRSPRLGQEYTLGEKVNFSIAFDKGKKLANTRISKRKKTMKVPFWSNPIKIKFQCQSSQAVFQITEVEYAKTSLE